MPPINYAWIIFFFDCVKCLMLIPLTTQHQLLSRDVPRCICTPSKWAFPWRFISLVPPKRNENTAAELWFPHIKCNCRGHRQSSEALGTDNLHGCKSTDRERPQKAGKYGGDAGKLTAAAAAACSQKNKMMRQKLRERRETEGGRSGRARGLRWPDPSRHSVCWASE